jgi:hypothetical protein
MVVKIQVRTLSGSVPRSLAMPILRLAKAKNRPIVHGLLVPLLCDLPNAGERQVTFEILRSIMSKSTQWTLEGRPQVEIVKRVINETLSETHLVNLLRYRQNGRSCTLPFLVSN